MIMEIGSFKFDGFYESVYNNSDMFISDENELKDEILSKYDLNIDYTISDKDFDVDYDFIDYDEYKKDVCKCFMENYIEKIVDVLPSWITEFDFFKFEKSDDDIVVISPKYYNYSTDRCYCNIETNIETLNLIKHHTLNLKGAKEYIKDNFTSRDGFISHVTNSYEKWKLLNISDYEQGNLP